MKPEVPSTENRNQRMLAAIVFTDGVNFSARMSADEEHTLKLIDRDLNLMRTLCTQNEGRVLKSTGDGLLMCFTSAVQAVSCALEIQQSLNQSAAQLPHNDVLVHRIGIHLGDVFFRDGDVMGNGVNIAARLESKAEPGGVCISKTVFDVVKKQLNLTAHYLGELVLKNIEDPIPAYNLQSTDTAIQDIPASATPASATSASATLDMAIGSVVANRYKVIQPLGEGGFGRTYLVADSQRFDEWLVLKEFMPHWSAGYTAQNAKELFHKEAGILYQINHPQIPNFLAWFEEKGRLFIVQEYVNGETYASLLKKRLKHNQVFSVPEIIDWLKGLLPVLSYIHDRGIIHRDISPDNIMLSANNQQPILIDFGLVKQTMHKLQEAISSGGKRSQGSQGSQANSFAGKIGYAPREQMSMGQCFPCSDLYALGVTAIVLLTGQEPSELVDPHNFEWQWQKYIQVADGPAQVFSKMLADRPKDRYQSAQEVLEALHALEQWPQNKSELASDNFTKWGLDAAIPTPTPVQTRTGKPADQSLTKQSALVMSSASSGSHHGLSDDFRAQCERELANAIGPMARMLLNQALSQDPYLSQQDLIERLVAKIPNDQVATEFRQRMK